MAAPFSGEEFYAKRSFFSSILGLKFGRQTKNNGHAPVPSQPHQIPIHQQYVGSDQPCSSRTILTQVSPMEANIPIQNQANPYLLSGGDFEGRDRSLSDQLADTLLLTSHHASPEPQQLQQQQSILSPHDIYEEIVCECAHFDQQTAEAHQHHHHHQNQQQHHPQIHDNSYYHLQTQHMQPSLQSQPQHQHPHTANIPAYYQYSPSSIQYPSAPEPTTSPTFCFNCHNCQNNNTVSDETRIKASVIEELANKTSLEDLVKLVVAAVKDAGGLGRSDKKQESPEEILRRKRQQNNEAAARYRKRQRDAKMNASNELETLTTRNVELKAELSSLQDEINNLKSKITCKQIPTTTLSKS